MYIKETKREDKHLVNKVIGQTQPINIDKVLK